RGLSRRIQNPRCFHWTFLRKAEPHRIYWHPKSQWNQCGIGPLLLKMVRSVSRGGLNLLVVLRGMIERIPFPALADLLHAYRWNLPTVEWKLVKSFRQGDQAVPVKWHQQPGLIFGCL